MESVEAILAGKILDNGDSARVRCQNQVVLNEYG